MNRNKWLLAAVLFAFLVAIAPGFALAQAKPNIVFIMGDDIGMWNISAYHRTNFITITNNTNMV